MEGGINDTEGCVRKALGLIPLLISEAYYTKVFSRRWKAITTQLELLNQTIASIITEPLCCFGAENPLLTELLSNLVSTLQVARELAKCCSVLSSNWKLIKRSDLDMLVNKLIFHQRDLQIVMKSGLLGESGDANIVFRPGLGATRDALAFFLRGLFVRLQIGNTQVKEEALFSLVQILLEDENDIIVVANERLEIKILFIQLMELYP